MNKSHMYDSNVDKNLNRDARSKMLFTKAHKLVLYFILGSIYLESNRAEIKGVDYFWGIKSRKTQEACTESVNCIGNPFYCY